MEERDVLWWLGTREYSIALFVSGYGLCSRVVGGKWGKSIPAEVLDGMEAKGWLWSSPNGGKKNYEVTWEGQRQAARVQFNL